MRASLSFLPNYPARNGHPKTFGTEDCPFEWIANRMYYFFWLHYWQAKRSLSGRWTENIILPCMVVSGIYKCSNSGGYRKDFVGKWLSWKTHNGSRSSTMKKMDADSNTTGKKPGSTWTCMVKKYASTIRVISYSSTLVNNIIKIFVLLF